MKCKIKNIFCENKKSIGIGLAILMICLGLAFVYKTSLKNKSNVYRGESGVLKELTPEEKAVKIEEMRSSEKITEGQRPVGGHGPSRN